MKAYSIGREAGCDIVIYDSTDVVSRRHAVLNVHPNGKMFIVDQSRNGTYVNGIRVTPNVPVPVTRKDIISFAHVVKLDWSQVPATNLWMKIAACVVGVLLLAGIGWGVHHLSEKPVDNKSIEQELDNIALNDTVFTVEEGGKAIAISFKTNKAWTASADQSWCILSKTSGEAGEISITATVDANTTDQERIAKITIKAGTATVTATVKQAKKKEEVKKKQENQKKKEPEDKKKEDKKKDDPATRNIG